MIVLSLPLQWKSPWQYKTQYWHPLSTKTALHFERGAVHDSFAIELPWKVVQVFYNLWWKFTISKRAIQSSRANPKILASLRASAEIHLWSDVKKHGPKRNPDTSHLMQPSGIWISICDSWWHFFCKSLVFGLVDPDSFHYFDDIYDSNKTFTFRYPVHIVIYWKKSVLILSIIMGDICNLSQIFHYPDSNSTSLNHLCVCLIFFWVQILAFIQVFFLISVHLL